MMCQMVCAEPPGKLSMETVGNISWTRAGTFKKKKYLAGSWTNHLSIIIKHRLTSTKQINKPYDVVDMGLPAELVGQSSCGGQVGVKKRHNLTKEILSIYDINVAIAAFMLTSLRAATVFKQLLLSQRLSHLNQACSCRWFQIGC